MRPEDIQASRAAVSVASGKLPVSGGGVVSMAILFREVKRHVQATQALEQKAMASRMAGQEAFAHEHAARGRNLDKMRKYTRSHLSLSMGIDPFMMAGARGLGDPTTAAYITQAASRQPGGRMGLGMV